MLKVVWIFKLVISEVVEVRDIVSGDEGKFYVFDL